MIKFNIKDNNLVFGGCDTTKLAEEFGTPLYVVSEEIIKDRCDEINRDFLSKYENTMAAYASKAFLNLAMCKIIEKEGLGLDVVSGGEFYTAMRAGFPLDKVLFHGNNKTKDELELAIKNNVGRIVIDNFYELDLVNEIGQRLNKTTKVLYRITPGVKGDTHKYISTGQKDSKFGIPITDDIVYDAVKKGIEYEYVDLVGFHFHVGSQLFDKSAYVKAVDKTFEIMKEAKDRFGFITKELNTGGGYGIYYANGDCPKPLKYFTDAIMDRIYNKCEELDLDIPRVIIEPGRWIIGQAGITLYRVGAIKDIPGVRTYISVDGGMTDNPRPALYGAKYRAVIANKIKDEKDNKVTVAGKCCETGDILIRDLEVPNVESGDLLAVLGTGAYNYSMSNNYNKIPRPAVVLVNKGNSEVIVERETYDELLNRYKVPERLK